MMTLWVKATPSTGEGQAANMPVVVIMISVGLGILAASVVGFVLLLIADRYRKSRGETRYALEKPAWDMAMQRWNRLYYCHRDGIVFDSETRETTQPQAIRQFVYR